MSISVEVATCITRKFGLGFTEQFITKSIMNNKLRKLERSYYHSNTKYNYYICENSFIDWLMSFGISENDIRETIIEYY